MHSVRSFLLQTFFSLDTYVQRRVWKTTDLGQYVTTDFSLWVVGRLQGVFFFLVYIFDNT